MSNTKKQNKKPRYCRECGAEMPAAPAFICERCGEINDLFVRRLDPSC